MDIIAGLTNFGGHLIGYGERFVRFSENHNELGWAAGSMYFGEWSFKTHKPHGRGIRISNTNRISIGYWEDGYPAAGKFVHIFINDNMFKSGECTVNA